jgi:hypothetical protein
MTLDHPLKTGGNVSGAEFFAAEITEEIRNDVRKRLLLGGNLAPRGCDRVRAKLALLLVLELNPKECLTKTEAALLYGISEHRFREGSPSLYNKVNL